MTDACVFRATPLALARTERLPRARVQAADLLIPTGLLALFALQTWLILDHEPWLDEWQALRLVLASPDLTALAANLRYEGHPPLWYLVLAATLSIVPPLWALAAAQLVIATTTQYLVQFRAPFNRIERLLIGAGYLVLFDYGTIARGYSLGVMLAFATMALWRSRAVWLCVALLPLTDFQFGVLSLIAVAALWAEGRRPPWGVALWTACGLAAAWSIVPQPADIEPAAALSSDFVERIANIMERLGLILLPLPTNGMRYDWEGYVPGGIGAPFGAGFILLCLREARRVAGGWTAMLFFLGVSGAFSLFVYPFGLRHFGLVGILLILLAWRGREQGANSSAWFRAWLAVGALCGLIVAGISATRPFDTAPRVVRFIRAAGLEREPWAVYPIHVAVGVNAYTGIGMIPLDKSCTQSFVRWNKRARISNPEQMIRAARGVARRHGPYYLLTSLNLKAAFEDRELPARYRRALDPGLFQLLLDVPPGIDGHAYRVYRVGKDYPATGTAPAACER